MLFDNVVEAVLGFVTNPVFVKYGLIGLFLNGVLSSVTPLPTEAMTSALILSGHDLNVLFLVLAISSTIGGYLAYYIGYGGKGFLGRIFSNRSASGTYKKGQNLFTKYGWMAILASSWIPLLGDVIPVAAGIKKYDLKKFAIAISIGKVTKSAAIVYLTSLIMPYFSGV